MELGTKHRWPKGLALPALPTTPEAHHYFFSKIHEYSILTSTTGKGRIDYQMFAQEWNWSADGITHLYITTEVFYAYAKTWEKINRSQVPSLCFGIQLVLMSIYLLRISKLIQWVCFDHNTVYSFLMYNWAVNYCSEDARWVNLFGIFQA